MQVETRPDTFETIYHRRAVRAFTPDTLDKATVLELLNAAVQAPTAMHLEPWAFAIIQDRDCLHRYSDQAKAALLGPAHEAGTPIRSQTHHPHDHLAMLDDPAFNIFYNASTLVVICRKTGGTFADADCWLAAENFMLAATAKGLGTCCIGFALPVLNMAETKLELGIPSDGAAVAPIIVGVPSNMPAPTPRKAPEILRWL